MATQNFQLETLIELAEELRRAGFDIGTQQTIAAQDLLIALAAHNRLPDDPRQWRTLLAPIFCASPGQQEEFYHRFEQWRRRHPELVARDESELPDEPDRRAIARGSLRWLRTLLWVAALALLILLVGYLATRNHRAPVGVGNQPQQTPAPGAATPRLELVPLPAVSPSPTPQPQQPIPLPPIRFGWRRVLVILSPLLLFAVWWLWRRRERRAMLRKLQAAGNPSLHRIPVKGAAELLFQGTAFRLAIQELRRHRRVAVRELDVAATVQATLDRGGMFTPRYGLRKASPEYLLLIDRASFGDQQARFGDELARRLEANGVFVDCYYFQNDPRTCRALNRNREPDSPVVTLLDLAARYPEHQLLIFGDGAGLFSPVTGEPEPWLNLFSHWSHPVLLTPELAAPPQHRRLALAENDFLALPANAYGLAALTEATDRGNAGLTLPKPKPNGHTPPFPRLLVERPKRWLERSEPRSAVANELCEQVNAWLGDEGWYWLSACAVYPALSWDITLYLGFKLFGKAEQFESWLLRLVRLPWFRYGTMPDWLRWRLITSFTPEQETAVRHALEELLLSALDNPRDGIELEIAEPEPDESPGDWRLWLRTLVTPFASWRRRRQVTDAINDQAEDSPLRDYVLLSFLSGSYRRRAAKLTVGLPKRLRSAFFPQGRTVQNWRPVLAGVAALAASGILLLALWPKQQPIRIAQPAATLATVNGYVVDLGNGVNLQLVQLPGGEFTMGSERDDDEKPQHRVQVSPFAIGRFEITQAQWKAVMGAGNNPSYFKGDELPVEQVSWNAADTFVKRLSAKTGLQFRLPTEAEWEYACRAGSTTEYSFGDDENQLGQYAWFSGNSDGMTHPIGQKKPNNFGLYDMHGNVWEWCQDWFDANYYTQSPKLNPTGPTSGEYRVVRGGSWGYGIYNCRSAGRYWYAPGYIDLNFGFRVVFVARTS